MSVPQFSVIVPTLDRPQLLQRALASIAVQHIADLECIVIDDAGSESPRLPNDDRFALLRLDSRSGPAAARNAGIRKASGRYLAFLDDDDTWLPERLNAAVAGLATADVAICGGTSTDGNYLPARQLHGFVHDVILDRTTPHLGQTALHRVKCPDFDERYLASQDVEWWLRLSATTTVVTVQRAGFIWHHHQGPRGLNTQEMRIECGLMLLEEHSDYFNSHPRASAFRWLRIAAMARDSGDRALARRALAKSLTSRPSLGALRESVRFVMP